MDLTSDNTKRKPLVTVEFQTEVDVVTGERERRLFVKMYFEARQSGLLAAIPGELWKMLCVLATYMDENGDCYPTQERIARDLGLRRQRVNERIQALLNFRFSGRPVLTLKPKVRYRGRWNHNIYRIEPVSALKIFHNGDGSTMSGNPDMAPPPRTVSASTDTVGTDTNKTHQINKNVNVNGFEKATFPISAASAGGQPHESRVEALASEILTVCGDPHSRGYYRQVAKTLPADLIYTALSQVRDRAARGPDQQVPRRAVYRRD